MTKMIMKIVFDEINKFSS